MPAHDMPSFEVLHPRHFAYRHIGPRKEDVEEMAAFLGYASLDALIDAVVPEDIRLRRPLELPPGRGEREVLQALRGMAEQNQIFRSHIGMGYYGTFVPQVIQRNILENPGWYTAYTPYQAEISQGRMEALVNFQTMVCDLTGMAIANASMLDEATSAAEAMTLARRSVKSKSNRFVVAGDCHPQTIEVIQTRAKPLGIDVVLANSAQEWSSALEGEYFAALA
ncbi:MAG: glycine dehydrogenase (aminomethyl-transferring), partial [Gemmatimonadales bacterium]